MKKIYYLVLCFCIIGSWGCYKDDIDNLKNQISEIEKDQIKTITQQIVAVDATIANLEKTDSYLKSNIKALESEAQRLQNSIKENADKDAEYKKTLEAKLSNIESVIQSLQEKDKAIEAQIVELKIFVEEQLKTKIEVASKDVKDWATTTFATLAQMESANNEIANLKGELQSLINNIDVSISEKLIEIKESLELMLNTRLAETESSIKLWVNEQLEGYLTISKAEQNLNAAKVELSKQLEIAKNDLQKMIESLEKNQNSENAAIRAEIETLRTILNIVKATTDQNKKDITNLYQDLNASKIELTEKYTRAIQEAIINSEGKLTAELTNQIAEVNSKIDTKVSEINSKITIIDERIADLENKITVLRQEMDVVKQQVADLLARIQTINYIPEYSDGTATMSCEDNGDVITKGSAVLKFELHPANTATELVKIWQSALSVKGIYTKTRAVGDFVNLPIQNVTEENGVLSVVVSGENLVDDYYKGNIALNAYLQISDGKNDVMSNYVRVIPSILRIVDDVIVVDETKFNVPNAGQDIELKVRHDVDYDLVIDVDWIAAKQTRALVEERIVFNIQENTSGRSRIGKITFKSKDQFIKQEVTIYQGCEYSEHDISLKVDVKTPGSLSSILTPEDRRTVTYLIVTGKLNEKDFTAIRRMFVMEKLDLRDADCDLTATSLVAAQRLLYLKFPLTTTEMHANSYISEIDASNCNNLISVDGGGYGFLDVSNCANLTEIDAQGRAVNVSNCANLSKIVAKGKSINASNCANLTEIDAQGGAVNVSNCPKLSQVFIRDGAETFIAQNSIDNSLELKVDSGTIKEMDLSSSKGVARVIITNSPQLKKLNLSNCINLTEFKIPQKNVLEYLDLSGTQIQGLGDKEWHSNYDGYSYHPLELPMLKHFNLSNCKHLSTIIITSLTDSINSTEIADIDVSNCSGLYEFWIRGCGFVNLDFSTNPNLSYIDIYEDSNLVSIDISKCLNLKKINCSDCPKIDTLYVWKNFDRSTIKFYIWPLPNFIEK